MEHPYGKQYGQEGNPRAYMTMRDYRNLPYQWGNQPPVGRNPNPNMSMREYRDQWMSGPVYSVPSTYPPPLRNDYPEPRPRGDEGQRHSSYQGESIHTISEKTLMIEKLNILTRRMDEMEMKNQHNIHSVNEFSASQPSCYNPQSPQSPQPLQSIHPLEQAMLDLNRIMDDYVEANKKIHAHSIVTVEDNLNKELDGFQSEIDQNLDILQESISKLAQQPDQEEENLEEESQEEESLTETVLVEQVQLQPQEELKEESLEAPEALQDASVTFWPWKQKEQISALITEESSGHRTGAEPQELIFQPIPMQLNPSATAQDTKTPLPVAPSDNQVYILPTLATKPKPAAPVSKDKSNPLPAAPHDSVFILPMPAAQPKPQASTTKVTPSMLVLQNIRRLVASVHTFATTSKKMANAYIAWHSGWFGCGFGFGAPGPRHF